MQWQLIESDAELAAVLNKARGCQAVMVDTEFMRQNTFYPDVALLQLCFEGSDAAGTAWLVDPLTISDTRALVQLLEDPDVVKVLHSASEDLEVFQRWLGALPRPLFDTQKAAALVGMDFGMGYRNIVMGLCDEELPKGETRSNWLQRPLTESQCQYAAQDVIWLLDVYRKLAGRCADHGRLAWVLEDGEVACNGLATNATGYYKRIKGAWKLGPGQLAVLAAVSEWREEIARQKNKPRGWIIDDRACLQLAQVMPDSVAQLRDEVTLPASALRRYGEQVLQVVDAASKAAPPERLPGPLTARQRELVKQLKACVERLSTALEVAPQALASGKDYEALVRGDLPEPALWSGWRGEAVIGPLKQKLAEATA